MTAVIKVLNYNVMFIKYSNIIEIIPKKKSLSAKALTISIFFSFFPENPFTVSTTQHSIQQKPTSQTKKYEIRIIKSSKNTLIT